MEQGYITQKHYEQAGEFAGLWVRTAAVLRANNITTREQLIALVARGGPFPFHRIRGCGKKMHLEIVHWLNAQALN